MSSAVPHVERRGDGPLATYLKAMRAHPLVLMGIVLITLAAAASWLWQKEPVYEATAEILVSPLPVSEDVLLGLQLLRESNDPTRATQTAAALLDSVGVAQRTGERLGRGYDASRVQADVEVEPLGQSNIIAVTAQAADPRVASRLANVFASTALDSRRDVLRAQVADRVRAVGSEATEEDRQRLRQLQTIVEDGDPTLTLAQEAVVSSEPVGPPDLLVLLLAGVVGAGLGAGATILMELTNRRIRDPREILDLYPLPVLARIPAVSRARMRGRGHGSMPPAVREAYRTLQVQIEQIDQTPIDPKAILFTSANAGDGKTSSALELALALARDGRSVILFDFDLRKPELGQGLKLPRSPGVVSLLAGRRKVADVLLPVPDVQDLHVVTASGNQDDVLLLASFAARMRQILDEARLLADYVILDTPPLGEVSDALRLLPYADEVIMVARPNNTNRADLEATRDLLDRMGVQPLGMVLVGVGGLRSRYHAYGAPSGRSERLESSGTRQPR